MSGRRPSAFEVGSWKPTFFSSESMESTALKPMQSDIEKRLATVEPDVEVLAVEQVSAQRVRLVIDHPRGVDLALCERVTAHLRELLALVGLEVSSPGPRRPLRKPDHFRRFVGQRARVRTREPRDGHSSFTGELLGASDDEVTMAADAGIVSIPYSEINRSNLLGD